MIRASVLVFISVLAGHSVAQMEAIDDLELDRIQGQLDAGATVNELIAETPAVETDAQPVPQLTVQNVVTPNFNPYLRKGGISIEVSLMLSIGQVRYIDTDGAF